MTRSPRPQVLWFNWLIACAAVALSSGACTYDFDRFEPGRTPGADQGGEDAAGMDASGGDEGDADRGDATDQRHDAEEIPGAGEAAFGEACEQDASCASALCVVGRCAAPCEAKSTCALASAECVEVGREEPVCVLGCEQEGEACQGEQQGLSCVRAVRERPRAPRSERRFSFLACAVDEDKDHVADLEDNCLGAPNARQLDADGDGVGDVCDASPRCAEGHDAQGRRTIEDLAWSQSGAVAPSMVSGGFYLLLDGGGKGGEEELGARRVGIDRRAMSVEELEDNLYAARDLAHTALGGGGTLSLPGARAPGAAQRGRWLWMGRGGEIEQSAPLEQTIYEPVIGHTRAGEIIVAGYLDEPALTLPRLRVWRVQGEGFQRRLVTRTTVVMQQRAEIFLAPDARGGVRIYTGADIDELNPGGPAISRHVVLDEGGDVTRIEQMVLPVVDVALGAIRPAYVSTRGGFELVFDRTRGGAYAVRRGGAGGMVLTPAPRYDLVIDTFRSEFVSHADHFALTVVGDQVDGGGLLKLTEYALHCAVSEADRQAIDEDADGVEDTRDNCAGVSNPGQEDADGDGSGDACDEDADGDGRPNAAEIKTDVNGVTSSLALDTDDDGVDNALDEDDDNDGLPDLEDRFPWDTDNDGVHNAYDDDDDGDGVPDLEEWAAGTDPYEALDYPGVGAIVFIRRDESGGRQAWWGRPAALDQAERVELGAPAEGLSPHRPRFSATGRSIAALNGAPQEATEVLWGQVEGGMGAASLRQERFALEVGAISAVGVAVSQEDLLLGESAQAFYVVRQGEILRASAAVDAVSGERAVEAWVSRYEQLEDLDVGSDARLYFVGGVRGCKACESVYSAPLSSPQLVRAEVETLYGGLSRVWRSGALVVVGDEGEVYIEGEEVKLGAGMGRVESAVALGGGRAWVVSAQGVDGGYDLWYYDGTRSRWRKLLDEAQDDVIELDWRP